MDQAINNGQYNAGFISSASSKSQMADPEKTTTAWKLMTDVESFADIQFVAGVPYNTLSSGADVVGMKNPNETAKFMRTHLGRLDAALFFLSLRKMIRLVVPTH